MNTLFTKLKGMAIRAKDGNVGSLADLYFDDQTFQIRYLVVDTNKWLPGRQVLVAPTSVLGIDLDDDQIAIDLTKEQIQSSPERDQAQPISRRFESLLHDYYGWYPYWAVPAHGILPYPTELMPKQLPREMLEMLQDHANISGDGTLRSLAEVHGYQIHTSDDLFGEVEDFLIDVENALVTDLVLNNHRWLPFGKRVLMPAFLLSDVSFFDHQVSIAFSKADLLDAPEFDWQHYHEETHRDYVNYYASLYEAKTGEQPIAI